MKELISKADVLVEALPDIPRFRNSIMVIKFGGSAMEDAELVAGAMRDVVMLEAIGIRPVVVHGGGKAISAQLKLKGVQPRFVRGLRVTDDATVQVVEHVLNKGVNPELVRILNELGCPARGIHGEDILSVVKHVDPKEPELDWGWVGDVQSVDDLPVRAYLEAGITPVITPLGSDETGQVYNINADSAAAGLAERLKARKLVFLSDVPGLLSNPEDRKSLISTLHFSEVEDLIDRGVIGGGMLPKIGGALKAIRAGVRKTHIIDAALPHSLLLELFTDRGVGTEIVADE
jgi:acetylglutamate kinase